MRVGAEDRGRRTLWWQILPGASAVVAIEAERAPGLAAVGVWRVGCARVILLTLDTGKSEC